LGTETILGAGTGIVAKFMPMPAIEGLNAGRGSYQAVTEQVVTKLENGTINNITTTTAEKIFVNQSYTGLSDSILGGTFDGLNGDLSKSPNTYGSLGLNVGGALGQSTIKPAK